MTALPDPSLLMPALSCRQAGTWCLRVHVQPGARRSAVCGMHGDRLKVVLAAPPLDGRANEALVRLVAQVIGVPTRSVTLEAGERSRDKTLRIETALDGPTLAARLGG